MAKLNWVTLAQAIEGKTMEGNSTKTYAVYQGDDFRCMGTTVECAEYLGVTPGHIRACRSRKANLDIPYDYRYIVLDVTDALDDDPYSNYGADIEVAAAKYF